MYQLQAEVEIDAAPARVWQVLTDFASYPKWTGWKGTISGEAYSARLPIRKGS